MAPYYYSNGFSPYWYKEHLEDYDFEIEETSTYGNYFSYLGQEILRVYSMSKKYSRSLSREEKYILYSAGQLLAALSIADKGSQEVLCFGYMVKARKI